MTFPEWITNTETAIGNSVHNRLCYSKFVSFNHSWTILWQRKKKSVIQVLTVHVLGSLHLYPPMLTILHSYDVYIRLTYWFFFLISSQLIPYSNNYECIYPNSISVLAFQIKSDLVFKTKKPRSLWIPKRFWNDY